AGHVVLVEQTARDDQVRAEHALGGDRAGVARGFRAVLQTQNVFGDLAGFGDVLDRGADVFGGVVVAAQAVQIAAEGVEQLRRLLGAAVADDDRLAAAHLQIGHGVLVAHALGKAQHVFQRFGRRGVVPHAGAADSRAARGGVHRNNSLQAGFLVVEGVDAFMVRERRRFKQRLAHDRPFLGYFLCAWTYAPPDQTASITVIVGSVLATMRLRV